MAQAERAPEQSARGVAVCVPVRVRVCVCLPAAVHKCSFPELYSQDWSGALTPLGLSQILCDFRAETIKNIVNGAYSCNFKSCRGTESLGTYTLPPKPTPKSQDFPPNTINYLVDKIWERPILNICSTVPSKHNFKFN